MTRAWDFVVAGAGSAGSRAAELLARTGASVLLFDPKAPWEKPCGGGLSAAALRHTPELAELAPQCEMVREARDPAARSSARSDPGASSLPNWTTLAAAVI